MLQELVTKKLCACVSITSKCSSVYSLQDKTEEAEEYTLLIKPNANQYAALEQAIEVLHKYEIPEIIAIDISQGSSDYLNWFNSTIN